MKIKNLLTKTLLAAGMLCVGVNGAWADTTVGATDFSTALDAEGSYSSYLTIRGDGTAHFTFVNYNNAGSNWENWYLYCANNDKSSEYFRLRADNWEDKAGANTNCINNYDWDNFSSDMNGATVDMYITRIGSAVMVSSTITTTGNATYRYSYTYVNASMTDNITVWLGVRLSYLTISNAETLRYNNPYLYDFNNNAHPFSYSSTNSVTTSYIASLNGGDGNMMVEFTDNASRTESISYTSNTDFTSATDYVFEFDWNQSSTNSTGTTLTVTGASGTLLTVTQAGNTKPEKTFTANSATLATHTYSDSRQLATPPAFYHFIFSANSTKGVYLTVLYNGTTVVVANQRIADFTTISSVSNADGKSYTHIVWDDLSLKVPAVAGVVATPTYTITEPDGTNRKFTLACTTAGTTIYYASSDLEIGATGWSTYTTEVSTDAATIYMYAEDEDGYTSSKTSFETGAGTAIVLNTPKITKTAYSNGTYTIRITDSQSNLELVPASTTIYYSVDGGSASVYSSQFLLSSGSTVTAYAVATGFSNSDNATLTAIERPVFSENWKLDFSGQIAANSISDMSDVTINTETESFKIGNTSYYPISATNFTSNDNFAVASNNTLKLRSGGNTGLYTQASGNRNIAIGNLTSGQYVIINCNGQADNYVGVSGVGELMSDYSTTGQLIFRAKSDGNTAINLARYTYIQSIQVLDVVSNVSVTLGSNGYGTFASPYALDLANLPAGLTAYKAAVNGTTVNFTEVTDAVQANTGLLLKGDASESYSIPVAASGSDISASNSFLVNDGGSTFTADADYYYFGLMKNTLTFGKFDPETVAIPASKAYLKVLKSSIDNSPARSLTISFDDETTTGIDNVNVNHNDNWFDLQGRRVNQPSKGLYIVNGKKIVIK